MFVIAEITLQHQFFPDCVWRDATLLPDQNTSEAMRRLGLSLVASGNVWRIYGYAPTGRTAFLQYCVSQDACSPFRFWLVQQSTWLLAVTVLPGDWKGVLGFSSQRITADRQMPGAMIMGPAQAQSAPAIATGEICLYPADLLSRQAFTVTLLARATVWEYRLIPRGQRRLQNPQIVDASGQIAFNPASIHSGDDDGQNGWVTRSTSAITLQQVPPQRFALVDIARTQTQSGRSRQQTVMSVLPTPAADRLFTAYCADQQPVSVMYVYV
ncbi:hypothetical protein SAMN05216563_105271 [Phytobacter palmae]|nr:hypothetical protein SAMN05216563_105271 [Phytobacter palmae]